MTMVVVGILEFDIEDLKYRYQNQNNGRAKSEQNHLLFKADQGLSRKVKRKGYFQQSFQFPKLNTGT